MLGSAFRLNPLRRAIGIEQELGEWGSIESYPFQYIHYDKDFDRSVEPSRHEMVLAPMCGDYLISGMVELAKAMHVSRAKVNQTCGFHVHVAANDLSYWDVRRLLMLWERIEPEVYQYLILPHRREVPTVTHYCQMLTTRHKRCSKCDRFSEQYPGHDHRPEVLSKVLARMSAARSTADIKTCLLRMLYGIENPSNEYNTVEARKGGKYEYIRYYGLNLHSWMYRGTIEFRMKEAPSDVVELVTWPIWCGYLIESITGMSDDDVRRIGMHDNVLAEFTRTRMPAWVARWVEEKISKTQQEKPTT